MSKSEEKKKEKEPRIAFLSSFLMFPVVVGCVLSQFFGLLQLPFSEIVSWLIGGVLSFTGLFIIVKWLILWNKEYQGQLITHGIFQYVRHPHYLGNILLMFGLSFFFRSIVSLLSSFLFIFLIDHWL